MRDGEVSWNLAAMFFGAEETGAGAAFYSVLGRAVNAHGMSVHEFQGRVSEAFLQRVAMSSALAAAAPGLIAAALHRAADSLPGITVEQAEWLAGHAAQLDPETIKWLTFAYTAPALPSRQEDGGRPSVAELISESSVRG